MKSLPSRCSLSRRDWLQASACGFGGVALEGMLSRLARAANTSGVGANSAAGGPHYRPSVQRVIFLFMSGGPSQQDLFDSKPHIVRNHGQRISAPYNDKEVSVGVDKYLALAPIAPVLPRGQSGTRVSSVMPHLADIVDDICLLTAVHTDNEAHAPASLQFHTGASAEARPSMGAWVSYGLGTENDDLPSFLTIHPESDVRTYGSAFLPAAHQGTPVAVPATAKDSAIRHLSDTETDPATQRRRLDFLQRVNRRLLDRVHDDQQMEGIIHSFELAFRMQSAAPKLVDLAGETKQTLDLYGVGDPVTDKNAKACLLARRLSEAGVRFVQVTMGGWDHHVNIKQAMPFTARQTDRPVAGLVRDLKRRGLLEDTLVVWSGEFGRTPWSQDLSGTSPIDLHGREHQPESFCAWLAGAGVKPGITFGQTDDFGVHGVADRVHIHDLHATLLHLLGIDHERLTYRHAGRDYRLTDVFGRVVHEILS